MHTFPGIVGPTIPSVVGISWTGIPLGPHGNLAADSDPLGVSAATGQLLTDDINVPEGIVLAGIRVMLRVPATPDERMTGDLTIEISELLLDGSTRSVASATITSDQFAEQVAAYFGATEYVAFHVPVEEATYLAPGHYMVQVTNVVSRQQVEQQAAATIDEDNVIFRAPETTWRFLSFSSPTPTPPPTPGRLLTLRVGTTALFAPTTPPASKPALGVDSAPIKMQIALDALTFSRSFSAPVQLVEGTDVPFEVASVRPEDPIYGVDGTRSVPIPQGVVISGDVTCTYSRCDQVFHALATRAGIPDDRIDLAGSFASSGTKYGAAGYRFDGAVTTQQTYKALFARLGFESRSIVDWQWDQMQLKWTSSLSEVTSSAVTFSRANMLPKRPGSAVASLKIKRTPETEIVNVIPARWKLDLFENKYRAAERFDSPPSIAAHGELAAAKGVFDFLYVRDNAMIASVCANKLERGAFSKRLFQWEAFLDALGLEKDTDAVDFDMSTSVGGGGGGSGIGEGGVGEGGWGGGSSAFAGLAVGTYALIEQVSYTWQNFKTILFQAREL
ncbi:MAG TPA: hypothetical protein VNG73_07480, partial [Gemmatimonadaceae bacterium]|nr:hypothetical protein [Gemmatimonadaceae bacterium]